MKADKNKVIEELIELRCKRGYSSTSLVNYLKETYDINQARSYELIKKAREVMGEIYNEMNWNALQDAILFLENLKEKLIGSGDNKGALEVQKELNKVNQLYIQKIEIESKTIEGINIVIKKDSSE